MKQVVLAIYLASVVFVGVVSAAQVQDVNVPSPAMDTQIPAVVILPDSYFVSVAERIFVKSGYKKSLLPLLWDYEKTMKGADFENESIPGKVLGFQRRVNGKSGA